MLLTIFTIGCRCVLFNKKGANVLNSSYSASFLVVFPCTGSAEKPISIISFVKLMPQPQPMTARLVASSFRRVAPTGLDCHALAISPQEPQRATNCILAPVSLSVNFNLLPKQVGCNKALPRLSVDETWSKQFPSRRWIHWCRWFVFAFFTSFRKHNLLFEGRQVINFLWEQSIHRIWSRMSILRWFWCCWTRAVELTIQRGHLRHLLSIAPYPTSRFCKTRMLTKSFMHISFSCGHCVTKAGTKGGTKWNSEAGRAV